MPTTLHLPALALKDYLNAHRWLWRTGHWKWLLWPFFLSILLFPLYIWSIVWSTDGLTSWILLGLDWPAEGWRYWLIWPFILVIGLIFGYILLKKIIMLLCAPLNAFLAEAVINDHLGQAVSGTWRDFMISLGRAIGLTLIAVIAGLVSTVLLLLLGIVPVVGAIAAVMIGAVIQGFLTAWGFFDPVYERSGLSIGQGFRRSLRYSPVLLGNGVPFVFLFQIPILGWTLAPSYGTVAGALTALRLQQQDTP
ncbi:MAG: EI24 domain-containing protein [Pseudomonadota bacterium]|nr:EI24 domain-containing protein [Pseudomonadota bacterium]